MNAYAQNVLESLQKNCSHQKEFMGVFSLFYKLIVHR